ncbi:MAG TPA: ABC transporter substrate-binding protein [Stellaceae bacterium]|nr:ABC transporter substrate-binding protein [Stellaceae bacterium]
MWLRIIMATLLALGAMVLHAAAQEPQGQVKIGVLTDLSGGNTDALGDGAVVAAQLAVTDTGLVLGGPVQVIAADYDRSPEVGAAMAREWYDNQGVDVIVDGGSSPVALAIEEVSRERRKLALFSGPATAEITAARCSPYAAQWTYDSYALAHVTAATTVKEGGKTWYFIGADTALSRALVGEATSVIEGLGGRVLGADYAPRGTSDFGPFLIAAQASKADIIGLATRAGDVVRVVREGAAFGIAEGGQKFAPLLMFITDVDQLGIDFAQGLRFASAFYWDTDEATHAFSRRFFSRVHSMPTMVQAGVYSATRHYLKAVKAVGATDPDRVMQKMRETPINDFMTKNGTLRIDGRVIRDMYFFEVKRPAESDGQWDYLKRIATVPGDDAFRPLAAGGCPLATAPRTGQPG